MQILAIDPGPEQSAYVLWNGEAIIEYGLLENLNVIVTMDDMLTDGLLQAYDKLVVEKVQCFGMPVGESIFETVFWTGRFCEYWGVGFERMPRKDVKMHLCQSVRAKDSNVTQSLIDRFAPMTRNKGKGTKKEPGFFYGFKKDIWQAFALAVTWWDQNKS